MMVVIGFIFTVESFNPLIVMQNKFFGDFITATYRGTFSLLNTRLQQRPPDQWEATVESLAPEFGYPLRLMTAEQISEQFDEGPDNTDPSLQFLPGEPYAVAQKIPHDPRYLTLYVDVTEEQDSILSANGTLYLIKQRLQQYPEAQWAEQLVPLQTLFDFPLQLVTPSQLTLSETQQQRLWNEQLFWLEQDNGDEYYYYPLSSEQILIAGPILFHHEEKMVSAVIISLFVIMGIIIFLWLYPLWKDLLQIDRIAARFGDGQLHRRVDLPKRSSVYHLSHTFNQMADNIEKLIESHRHLTNAVSHDLRTPLSRMRFAADMLEEENDPDTRRRYHDSLTNSITSLEGLLNELLIHARFMRPTDPTHFAPTQLAPLLMDEIDDCRDDPSCTDIQSHIAPYLAENSVMCDKNAIRRAINNLLSNAQKHAHRQIILRADYQHGECIISIEDDGDGIPEAERESIFKPFTQLNNQQRDSRHGHGLGLAIVDQIAQWHQGSITVADSDLGGAQFQLRWPDRSHTVTE